MKKSGPRDPIELRSSGSDIGPISITTKLRRCISALRDPLSLHTSFRQMPSSRYHLSFSLFLFLLAFRAKLLLIPQAIGDGLFCRRRKERTKTTTTTTENRRRRGKSTRGETRRQKQRGEEVPLSRRIRARINIGQRGEVFVGAERNPLLLPTLSGHHHHHHHHYPLSQSREMVNGGGRIMLHGG